MFPWAHWRVIIEGAWKCWAKSIRHGLLVIGTKYTKQRKRTPARARPLAASRLSKQALLAKLLRTKQFDKAVRELALAWV
eukprot:8740957-Pyramimonas_sp.AAC.1